MTHIFINGKKLKAQEGETVLCVAKRNGFNIPTLCHHDALEPVGACRLCTVEITHKDWSGWKKLVTSCLYPVEEGLEVLTNSEPVTRLRKTVLDLLVARCPDSEVIRSMAESLGEITEYKTVADGSNCIMCYLCVRACAAMGCDAISAVNRGKSKEIAAPFHESAEACVGCGSCAEICPTGHIQMEDTPLTRKIWDAEFEFVRCEVCGKPTITKEHMTLAIDKRGLPADYYGTCASCKQAALAKRFGKVGS